MDSMIWYAQVTGEDSTNAVATRSGLYPATLSKQLKRGWLSPETVVAVARGYHTPVLDALVSIGFITETEAHVKKRATMSVEEALTKATDAQLGQEILNRCDTDGLIRHPILALPLQIQQPDENDPGNVTGLPVEPYDPSFDEGNQRHAAKHKPKDPYEDAGEESQLPPEDWGQ